MKTLLSRRILVFSLGAFTATAAPATSSIDLHATISPDSTKADKPPFFQASVVEEKLRFAPGSVSGTASLRSRVVQGEAVAFGFRLTGDGSVIRVTGAGVDSWSVRTDENGKRFLDVRPKPGLKPGDTLVAEVILDAPLGGLRNVAPLLITPADAVSSDVTLTVVRDARVALRVTRAEGLVAMKSPDAAPGNGDVLFAVYRAKEESALAFDVGSTGEFTDPVTLDGFRLSGDLTGDHAGFSLTATARVAEAGASCEILSGDAALREIPADAPYRVRMTKDASGSRVVALVFDKAGEFPVKLAFDARVHVRGDVRGIGFAVPAARVAPFSLGGLGSGTRFDGSTLSPYAEGDAYAGFLPPGGDFNLTWRPATRAESEAKLFFSTTETTEVTVGSGLLRRTSRFDHKILQGKLDSVSFALGGEGEILRVSGTDVLGWSVTDSGPATAASGGAANRTLIVKLARPQSGDYALTVESQNALGVFPASFKPLSITPVGAVRNGGFLRVSNAGAVRLEVTPDGALAQVAPSAFPRPATGATQSFVYRITSAGATYRVHADNILPEIAVSQVAVATLGEKDYALDADFDVEIREAPLRELAMRLPPGYAVASVSAPGLADHTVTPGAAPELRLTFSSPVDGRLLVKLRLEKNRAGDDTEWTLPAVSFPGAKSVRGFIGAAAAPGLRLSAGTATGLTEVATAFFPQKNEALQQAWRLRDPEWSATMKVEKLDVAVQSDVLHQYAVREGSVAESTLVNYVIVGAPLQSLRFRIPKGATNLEFVGGDIRGWKITGDIADVSLQRGVSGAFTLMATCELALNPRGGEPDLSGIRPLDVQSEQGYVLVTADRPFAVETKEVSGRIAAIEPAEIPSEYRMIADAPLLGSYRYSSGEYGLRLALTPRTLGGTVSQVVDLASLTTKVSREGACVTTCRYLVKSRGNPHLRLRIPKGLKMWTAKVNDAEVVPVTEGDETLVPLPVTASPDALTTVEVRVAQSAESGSRIEPLAPAPMAPVVGAAWKVIPDTGRELVAAGGDMAQISGSAAPDGVSDLVRHLRTRRGKAAALLVAALAGFGIGAVRRAPGTRRPRLWRIAGIAALLSVAAVTALAAVSVTSHVVSAGELVFTSSVLESGRAPVLRLANIASGGVASGSFGLGVAVAGLALAAYGLIGRRPAFVGAGVGALVIAPLFITNGLPLFLGATSLLALAGTVRVFRLRPSSGILTLLALGAFVAATPVSHAEQPVIVPIMRPPSSSDGASVESMKQKVSFFSDHAEVSAELRVSGRAGDRADLIDASAMLTSCDLPSGVLAGKREATAPGTPGVVSQIVLERDGVFTVKFAYRIALRSGAGEMRLPTPKAVADVVEVQAPDAKAGLGYSGRGVVSVSAKPGVPVVIVYGYENERTLIRAPKTRDARDEKLVFYSEVANLFSVSPGVVEGRHLVKIRPAQGVVGELTLEIPLGLTVSDVSGDAVGDWRYDPETRLLHIATESGRSAPFEVTVGTQSATGALPATATLSPLVVKGSSGAVGMLALASTEDVRFENISPTGLSAVNTDDFPVAAEGATIRRAYRHGAGEVSLSVRIAAVEPEVRVVARETLSVADDRVTLNAILGTEILRAGVFKLSFIVPDGCDVESVGGPSLAHWAEIAEGGKRTVVMNLRGRTLGRQDFIIALSCPGISGKTSWTPPTPTLVEASRFDGELLIVPEEGVRLHPTRRDGVIQTNPGRGAGKGALSFKLLQSGYKLGFDVENASPWIKCDWLQDMTVLDGRVMGAAKFDYTIENAAVRSLRIRLPKDAEGVRVSGPLVADAIAVPGKPEEWEVKLRRRAIGRVSFTATFRRPGIDAGKTGSMSAAAPADANIRQGWISLRAGGRLSLRTDAVPDSLRAAEWASVPNALRQGLPESTTTLRVVDPAFTLPVVVTTHDPAKLLAIRVRSAELRSVLSADGRSLTSCKLDLSLSEKRPLRFVLPEGARLWQVFVNGSTVSAAIDGKSLVAPVEPNPVGDSPATVELVYESPAGRLRAPSFDLPLENIVWKVGLPDGMKLSDWSGDAVRRPDLEAVSADRQASAWQVSSYDSAGYVRANEAVREASKKDADELLKLGGRYRASGDQNRAKNALSLAQKLSTADSALNEDARVQYGNLRAEQIEFGLNSRRFNNANVSNAGEAEMNQLGMPQQGYLNFTGEQADKLRAANGVEDNNALRKLAERLVALQQAGSAEPEGIRTLLPGKGVEVVFTRALYNETAASPLTISLSLSDPRQAGWGLRLILLAGAVLVAAGLAQVTKRKV